MWSSSNVCVCVRATHYVSHRNFVNECWIGTFQPFPSSELWYFHLAYFASYISASQFKLRSLTNQDTTAWFHHYAYTFRLCSYVLFSFCLRSRFILWATHIFHFPFFCFVLFLSSINDSMMSFIFRIFRIRITKKVDDRIPEFMYVNKLKAIIWKRVYMPFTCLIIRNEVDNW